MVLIRGLPLKIQHIIAVGQMSFLSTYHVWPDRSACAMRLYLVMLAARRFVASLRDGLEVMALQRKSAQ